MTHPLAEIWFCLSVAALLGVLAGWLLWGRRTRRIVASYRRRLDDLRENWEIVEERLAEELERASRLEMELKREYRALERSRIDVQDVIREKDETWREERLSLEDTLLQLHERILALQPVAGLPAQSRLTDPVQEIRSKATASSVRPQAGEPSREPGSPGPSRG
jgi:hypothetical protein